VAEVGPAGEAVPGLDIGCEEPRLDRAWFGVDIGKRHHHAVVDVASDRLFARRVSNDESALLALIGGVSALAEESRYGRLTCTAASPLC